MLDLWPDEAGRVAYLAGFHAAQALIDARTGRSVKSHGGVNSEFHRLVRGDARVDDGLRAFLARSYQLKTIADYETGPGATVTPEQAAEAITEAKRFVECMTSLVQRPERPSDPS
jgi:uncharacterized protein (UPF0332 family)